MQHHDKRQSASRGRLARDVDPAVAVNSNAEDVPAGRERRRPGAGTRLEAALGLRIVVRLDESINSVA